MSALCEDGPFSNLIPVHELALGEIIADVGQIIDISHDSNHFTFVVISESGMNTVKYERDAKVILA